MWKEEAKEKEPGANSLRRVYEGCQKWGSK